MSAHAALARRAPRGRASRRARRRGRFVAGPFRDPPIADDESGRTPENRGNRRRRHRRPIRSSSNACLRASHQRRARLAWCECGIAVCDASQHGEPVVPADERVARGGRGRLDPSSRCGSRTDGANPRASLSGRAGFRCTESARCDRSAAHDDLPFGRLRDTLLSRALAEPERHPRASRRRR